MPDYLLSLKMDSLVVTTAKGPRKYRITREKEGAQSHYFESLFDAHESLVEIPIPFRELDLVMSYFQESDAETIQKAQAVGIPTAYQILFGYFGITKFRPALADRLDALHLKTGGRQTLFTPAILDKLPLDQLLPFRFQYPRVLSLYFNLPLVALQSYLQFRAFQYRFVFHDQYLYRLTPEGLLERYNSTPTLNKYNRLLPLTVDHSFQLPLRLQSLHSGSVLRAVGKDARLYEYSDNEFTPLSTPDAVRQYARFESTEAILDPQNKLWVRQGQEDWVQRELGFKARQIAVTNGYVYVLSEEDHGYCLPLNEPDDRPQQLPVADIRYLNPVEDRCGLVTMNLRYLEYYGLNEGVESANTLLMDRGRRIILNESGVLRDLRSNLAYEYGVAMVAYDPESHLLFTLGQDGVIHARQWQ